MLCETFSMNQAEFEQVFALTNVESIFLMLDNTGNGLLDYFEIFTLMAILSESRIEDRVRFLFELYDMNGQ